MSTFACRVVEIKGFGKHPNADTLEITQADGCPVVMKAGQYQPGDWAVHIPIDAVVPTDNAHFDWLKDPKRPERNTHRVKAVRLRGVFSMGFLIPYKELAAELGDAKLGDDVSQKLGIKKYEEPAEAFMNTGNIPDPGFIPTYTDIEHYLKFKHIFKPEMNVVVTEKLHGMNARFGYQDGLYVGSHKTFKAEDDRNVWWQIAKKFELSKKLAKTPWFVLYGEALGTQDLKYGCANGEVAFRAFDLFDIAKGRYVDHETFVAWCTEYAIPYVPVLYAGKFDPAAIEPLAGGKTTLADHIREGIVIKADPEAWNEETGRTILKLLSEDYLLRKGGTEHH